MPAAAAGQQLHRLVSMGNMLDTAYTAWKLWPLSCKRQRKSRPKQGIVWMMRNDMPLQCTYIENSNFMNLKNS